MRRTVIVLILALGGAAAAGPSKRVLKLITPETIEKPRWTDVLPRPDYSDEVADRVRDAIAHRDARALVASLAAPLSYGGMPADQASCHRFGRRGVVKRAADLPAFAACLIDAAQGLTVLGHAPDGDHSGLPPRSLNVYADGDGTATSYLFISPPPSKPAPAPADDEPAMHVLDDEPEGAPTPRSRKPIVMASDLLDHALAAGTRDVVPDGAARAAIARAGGHVTADVQACFGEDGAIDRVRVVAPSGVAAYDRALVAAVKAYRIRPATDDEGPVPVCTTYRFIYPPG